MRDDIDCVPALDAGDPYPSCSADCGQGRQVCRCEGLCTRTDPLPLTRWTLVAAVLLTMLGACPHFWR